MRMKRLFAAALALTLGIGIMTSCGSGNDSSSQAGGSEGETASQTESETKEPVNMEIRDIPSTELVKEMTIGWNLGNTMDATNNSTVDAEVSWQPNRTSEPMCALLKDSGFNVFRVPVSWGAHMSDDYTVDPEWMARVHEIVDYGINNGLFVILNTHHEEWYFPTEENKEQDIEQLTALWKQIAEEFKGYDEHLIFEGLNEPRMRGTNMEWNGGDTNSRTIVAEYAQAFYKTVRESGGNNEKRHLMLTGYAASSSRIALQDVWLPENDDKVIVSVHAYLPYSLALDTKGTDKWDENSGQNDIDNFFYTLDDLFLSRNIPVIVGEFGTVNKDNLEDRIACAKYYVQQAKDHGVPMIWWDNNAFVGNGENFGLMDREPMPEWKFPELVTAMTDIACAK